MTRVRQAWRTLRIAEWGLQIVIVALLALSYYGTLAVDSPAFARCAGTVLLWTAFLLAGTYVLNSYCDREDDRLKGAQPVGASWQLAAACFGVALLLAGFFAANHTVRWLVLANTVVVISYSLPPIRLKARGAAGVLAAAVFQRLPAFWMIALSFSVAWLPALAITLWLAVVGTLFIIEHQIEDFDVDVATGVATGVVRMGLERASRLAARLYVVLALETLAAVIIIARAARSPAWSIVGAGIIAGGTAILMIAAHLRYGRRRAARTASMTHLAAIGPEHDPPGSRTVGKRHAQRSR